LPSFLPPLSLYVHIPWCVRKCPYCDFNSHEASGDLPEADYLQTLVADLERDALYAQGRKLQSIFFGGGTPSLFSADAIETILLAAEKYLGFAPDIEITLEANPGTVERQRFADYRKAGVNRLSIGAQSLQDTHLQALGRIHNAADIHKAIDAVARAGFDNFNIDLMHGLPDQSVANALDDLTQVIALTPTHISWYQLTIEKNTVFYRQPPPLPSDDLLADIETAGSELLRQQGYVNYEVSAFSQSQRQSQHNLNYWQFGDYLGIGAGAHGKITDMDTGIIYRSNKTRLPGHYLQQTIPLNRFVAVDADALPLEYMLNVLRLSEGVPTSLFSQRTGLANDIIAAPVSRLQAKGLLETSLDRLQTTALGRRYLNNVISEFSND